MILAVIFVSVLCAAVPHVLLWIAFRHIRRGGRGSQ